MNALPIRRGKMRWAVVADMSTRREEYEFDCKHGIKKIDQCDKCDADRIETKREIDAMNERRKERQVAEEAARREFYTELGRIVYKYVKDHDPEDCL